MPKKGRWYEDEFMKYYNMGMGTRDICKELGIGESAGYKFLQSKGLKSHAHKPIVVTQEQINLIKEKYLNNKTIEEIAEEMNIKSGTVNYWLRKMNITRPNGIPSDCNHNYFKEINTPNKAYFLGLLYADGGFMSNKVSDTYKKTTLCLELKKEDKYIVEEFKKQLESDLPLKEYIVDQEREVNGKVYKYTKHNIAFRVTCKNIISDLIKLGCGFDKTHNLKGIPDIPEEYIRYFLLGFFDGDGIASVGKVGKKQGYMGFCGTYEMMNSIMVYLYKELKLPYREPYYNNTNHIYYLQYSKLDDIKILFNYFYQDLDIPHLIRKENKIKKYIQTKINK